MKFISQKKRGFTLLELIIALGIMALISSVILPFFMGNYKSLNVTADKSQLHYEAEQLNSVICEKFMEVKSIEGIMDNQGRSRIDSSESVELGFITFIDGEDKKNILELKDGRLEIKNILNDETKTLGGSVNSIEVEPLYKETTIKNSSALSVSIIFKRNDQIYTIKNDVYLRNKP